MRDQYHTILPISIPAGLGTAQKKNSTFSSQKRDFSKQKLGTPPTCFQNFEFSKKKCETDPPDLQYPFVSICVVICLHPCRNQNPMYLPEKIVSLLQDYKCLKFLSHQFIHFFIDKLFFINKF